MALNHGDQNSVPNAMQQALQGANIPNPAQPTPEIQGTLNSAPVTPATPQATFTWADVGSLNTQNLNLSANSAALTTLSRALSDFWKDNLSEKMNLELLELDRNNIQGLGISVLVVCSRENNQENAFVAYHALLIEGSVDQLRPRRVTIGRDNLDVMILPCDAYDAQMISIIDREVRAKYPNARGFGNCDVETIHRDFDTSNQELLRRLTLNISMACRNAFNMASATFPDINVGAIAHVPGSRLEQEVKFAHLQEEDPTGLPVRADVTLEMSYVPPANNNALFEVGRVVQTRCTGYIDLIYNPSQVANNPYAMQNPYAPQAAMPTAMYNANLVITDPANIRIQSMPGILLAILNATFLAENNGWVAALRPVRKPNGQPGMHDIGAIGYDMKIDGKIDRIDTSPDQFDPNIGLAQLIQIFFHPGLVVSVDIPEAGCNTWALNMFAAAAHGDMEANRQITGALNVLTNGFFEEEYNKLHGNGIHFTGSDNRIHLGFYKDEDGRHSDIRDLDYLAVANIAGARGMVNLIEDWTQTFNNVSESREKRMAARQAIIQSLLPGAQFTGFATRAELSATTVEAAKIALQRCGYQVTPVFPYSDLSGIQARARAGYVTGSVLGANTSGIFRGGYSQGTGQNAVFTGRWR